MENIIALLEALANNGGFTLKGYHAVNYKTGYQVATEGVEVATVTEAAAAIQSYAGNCGVWYSEGIYYVDKSRRISTKWKAVMTARTHSQLSILKWSDMSLIWL